VLKMFLCQVPDLRPQDRQRTWQAQTTPHFNMNWLEQSLTGGFPTQQVATTHYQAHNGATGRAYMGGGSMPSVKRGQPQSRRVHSSWTDRPSWIQKGQAFLDGGSYLMSSGGSGDVYASQSRLCMVGNVRGGSSSMWSEGHSGDMLSISEDNSEDYRQLAPLQYAVSRRYGMWDVGCGVWGVGLGALCYASRGPYGRREEEM
jgi:hypothetical protein